jgi:subtilisin family serine protease
MVSAYANSRALVVILSVLLLSWGTFANFNPAFAVADDEKDDEKDDDKKITICHIPPGNPNNFQQILVSVNAVEAHLAHGDKIGKCIDDEEERAKIEKIKKQREETRNKNELKEKRDVLKEIKKDLNDLKKTLNDEEKQNIKTLVADIKEVIKKLNENPEYDKEHKNILKQELKETKLKIEQEMTSQEKISKNRIDSKIYKLSKSDDPKLDAKKLGFDFKNGKTKVVIELSDVNTAVVEQLSSLGKIDAKNDKYVQLTVKLSDLPKLRSIGGIDNIRPPFSAVQFDEELSEGVYFINADLAQFAGITGEGIKAAVLDLAFTENPKISDNVVEVKSFRQGIGYLPIQGNGDEAIHGTAVAEIIVDVAPDVELFLYSMETDIEFAAAVDEAISQQVDIIAMSAGWPNFPTDGTSHITKKIEEAVDNGIVFVVPAGNFGNKHWQGIFVDSNFNNWHEYSNSDEGLSITVTEKRIAEEKPIVAHLMWDVGMNDMADFELVLVDPLGQIVDYSANEQITKSDTAFEFIHHIPDTEGIYSIGVLYSGDISDVSKRPHATLEIFSVNDELEYPVTQSSVSVPADASGAIVVGAVNHLDGNLEPFSSQGPTNNGKLAPHVVGPDGVTTLALDGKPFYGTSATTPYVAGLAALILENNPDMSPEQLLTKIQQNTEPGLFSLQNEYNYATGYGTASAVFLIDDSEAMK